MEIKYKIYSVLKDKPLQRFDVEQIAEILQIKKKGLINILKKLVYNHKNIYVDVGDSKEPMFYYEVVNNDS